MGKRQKIIIISLVSFIVLAVAGVLIAQNVVTTKIEKFFSKSLPKHIKVDYKDLDVNVLNGNLKLVNPKLTIYGQTTASIILVNEMSSIHIDDVSYWDYIFKSKINIERIVINEPKVTYHHNKYIDSKKFKSSNFKKLEQDVHIGKLKVKKGTVSMLNVENDSLMFQLQSVDFELKTIHFSKENLSKKIPLTFEDYDLKFSGLFYQVNDYDNLEVEQSKMTKRNTDLKNLRLYTKYSKQKLSNMISIERDHVDFKVDLLAITNQEFGFHHDSIFYFKSPKVLFQNPILNIYRDKLITDDTKIKSLYSNMLRNLKFDLTLSEVLLKNGLIDYSEKVKVDNPAGELLFSNLNATIANLSNTYSASEKTNIDVNAIFMKSTPIKVNWYFDVNNVNDQFIFKGEIGKLPAQDLNTFSQPNLKVKFEGELLKTYFTIDGNAHDSNVDLKANYDSFKVNILQKDGKEKNAFLSAIANLFIKKDSEKESDHFREGSKTNVERDKTKSVFNFVWLNVQGGLLSVLTGDGKK